MAFLSPHCSSHAPTHTHNPLQHQDKDESRRKNEEKTGGQKEGGTQNWDRRQIKLTDYTDIASDGSSCINICMMLHVDCKCGDNYQNYYGNVTLLLVLATFLYTGQHAQVSSRA